MNTGEQRKLSAAITGAGSGLGRDIVANQNEGQPDRLITNAGILTPGPLEVLSLSAMAPRAKSSDSDGLNPTGAEAEEQVQVPHSASEQ